MRVLARQAVSQLVGVGLADQFRARRQQGFDHRRGVSRWRLAGAPARLADAGNGAGYVEHVLDGESQALQRALSGGVEVHRVEIEKAVFQYHRRPLQCWRLGRFCIGVLLENLETSKADGAVFVPTFGAGKMRICEAVGRSGAP